MVFSLKESSDSITKPLSSPSKSSGCIIENNNNNNNNNNDILLQQKQQQQQFINDSPNLLSQKQRSINISNEQSQRELLQQSNNSCNGDPNSPKYLTSSHSSIVIPSTNSSPILPEISEDGSPSRGTPTSPPFITSPKGLNSPRRLVGFFSKSTSYQSLLNSNKSNASSTTTTNNNSNNGSVNNSIHTSFNNNEIIESSDTIGNSNDSSLMNSAGSSSYSITTNSNNYEYSPTSKRLIRHEKSKSSPPLSPIISYLETFINNNNNNYINNSNNGSSDDIFKRPLSLKDGTSFTNSLIPSINSLKLNNITQDSNGSTIFSSTDSKETKEKEKEKEIEEKDLENYINMINNSGFINNTSNDNSLISNESSFSPIKEEPSPVPSPTFSPKPTLQRTRSNSKNVIYSPTSSPSNSCKIPTPSTPTIPQPTTPPLLNNISIIDTSINNSSSSDDNINNNNNNNIAKTPNNKLNISNPIAITNSGLKKSGNIDYLQINNNYVIPSPSPGTSNYPSVSIYDFQLIEKIGEGGFGQVFLAKKKDTSEIVAIKRMSKELIWSKNKVSHIKNERDILAQGKNHRWIVSLVYSFQDDQYLYLAMEYVPGGDLRSLLSALNSLDEDSARFYMSEMVEAVDSCHRLGYCHRDLKPENFLISRNGHVKLADFGLSKNVVTRYHIKSASADNTLTNVNTPTSGVNLSSSLVEHTPMKFGGPLNSSVTDFGSFKDLSAAARLAYSVVGSPFYMAPEVLQATRGYGDEVDWWSLGCMFYEFIFGVPPFDGDSPEEVMESVLKWKTKLQRPPGVSDQLWDLISGLINDGSTRLGSGEKGVENIKNHVFFKDVTWGRLHELEPPFVPVLQDDYDTTYFENTEKIDFNLINEIEQQQQQQQLLPQTPNYNEGGKKILDKIRSPVVYTNKHSGNIITSRSRPRNILGFTYPRAEDQPLLWNNNLLKNFEESTAKNIATTSINSDKKRPISSSRMGGIDIINSINSSNEDGNITPNSSPYTSNESLSFETKQEPSSPYGSYSNNNPF